MALEDIESAGKYIDDLVSTNPLSTDNPGLQGDNHIRGIKNTLKLSLPSITGPVTATQDELNLNSGKSSLIDHVDTLVNLEALTAPTAYASVYMNGRTATGDGGEGLFLWDSSDVSANVTSDTQQGIWVAPSSDATGASGAWKRVYSGELNVLWFGVKGDGSTVDTTGFQAALDYAAAYNKWVTGNPGETYLVTTLMVKSGTKGFGTRGGVILPNGTTNPNNLTTEAAVVLQGALTGGASVEDCVISLEIDMQNGDRTALLGDGCASCVFTGCKIYGFTNDATNNHRGIRIQEAPARNQIINNEIIGYDNPTQRGLLLDVWASFTGLLDFGSFFTGTISRQPNPATRNIISENILTNGSYALNLQGGEFTEFTENMCSGQNHRGIWMGNGSWYNVISNNQIHNFSSSAVLLAYSCSHNVVTGNGFINEGAIGVGGEAVINIALGSPNNLVSNNHCDAPVNYSVYVATDSSNNMIDGNYSKNAFVAAFAVENDWIDTRPANNFFSRPNYDDPDVTTGLANPPASSWTFNDLDGTTFQNNIVDSGYTGRSIAAFSVAHIENDFASGTLTKLTNVSLKNNRVLSSTNIGYGLYVYEHTAGQLEGLELLGNNFDDSLLATTADFAGGNTASAVLDMRDVGLVYAENNGTQLEALIHGTPITFTDADTTPDVSLWRFFECANTGATSITDFDGAAEGQQILVRGDVNTTIVYTSGLIRPKGLANVTGMSTNSLIAFKSLGGIWYEMFRNF